MSKLFITLCVLLIISGSNAQTIQVNPDGTHSVILNNGSTSTVVNPDGTHSTIFHNGGTSVRVNPDGTHATIFHNGNTSTQINPDGKHTVIFHNGDSSMLISPYYTKAAPVYTPGNQSGISRQWFFESDPDLLYDKKGLIIHKTKAVYKTIEIYNAKNEVRKLKQNEDTVQCLFDYHLTYNPLSLVGRYYSFETRVLGQYACGPPESKLMVRSVNLETPGPVRLTELFREGCVLDALKTDQWINTIATEKAISLNEVHTLKALFDLIPEYNFNETSFAVVSYDKKTGLAAIRLVGYESLGFNNTRYIQLGLVLKPTDGTTALFKSPSNFYMNRFPNGLFIKK